MGPLPTRRPGEAHGRTRPSRDKATLRAQARAFAFEGMPERDRFGVFDPVLRGLYVFAIMLGAVLAGGSVIDTRGAGAAPAAATVLLALLILGIGLVGYRRVWPLPAERELLLRMAEEDDEARSEREARARREAGRP